MTKKIAEKIVLLLLVFATSVAIAQNCRVTGGVFIRCPGQKSFVLASDSTLLPVDAIALARPDTRQPLASSAQIIVGSHSIILFPGASLRCLENGFYHLSGRIEIDTENAAVPLVFQSRKFFLRYLSGNLLLEVTPDSGTYVALRNKGDAFIKDENRRIVELEADQEIFFPLFGPLKKNNRLSSFWNIPPTGFASARVPVFSATSANAAEQKEQKSEEGTDPDNAVEPDSPNGGADDVEMPASSALIVPDEVEKADDADR